MLRPAMGSVLGFALGACEKHADPPTADTSAPATVEIIPSATPSAVASVKPDSGAAPIKGGSVAETYLRKLTTKDRCNPDDHYASRVRSASEAGRAHVPFHPREGARRAGLFNREKAAYAALIAKKNVPADYATRWFYFMNPAFCDVANVDREQMTYSDNGFDAGLNGNVVKSVVAGIHQSGLRVRRRNDARRIAARGCRLGSSVVPLEDVHL